jgi:hypothetical protein
MFGREFYRYQYHASKWETVYLCICARWVLLERDWTRKIGTTQAKLNESTIGVK